MSKEILLEKLKDVPEILETSIDMIEANQPVKIYEGAFVIRQETKEITISGHIQYDWFPSTGANFYGTIEELSKENIVLLKKSEYFYVVVNGFNIGLGLITSITYSNEISIKGTFRLETITGDKSIAVEKIKFCIPNFQDFLGESVKKITTTNIQTARNRITLENDKYIITIDKCIDHVARYNAVNEKGGYIITHIGELKPKKGNLTFQNIDNITYCLNIFLSYLNGKRTSAMFIEGIFKEEVIWCDYSNYHIDTYAFLPSWTYKNEVNGLNEIWKEFSNMWANNEDRDILKTAIHWYLECNKNSGFVEGSIIMAQTALELLYNWFIVENKRLLIGKDSENISAANKIRLLISQLEITYEVPAKFSSLKGYLKSEKLIDAPEAVVQIRNAIVHSQVEKRKKLKDIEDQAKSQALQLCLWYIELALLKVLKYNGIYSNRCSLKQSMGGKVELVPWKNNRTL
jgi:hypothetical protein